MKALSSVLAAATMLAASVSVAAPMVSGSFSDLDTPANQSYNLTTEGVWDWQKYGYTNKTASVITTNIAEKAGATAIGLVIDTTNSPVSNPNNFGVKFSWSDGEAGIGASGTDDVGKFQQQSVGVGNTIKYTFTTPSITNGTLNLYLRNFNSAWSLVASVPGATDFVAGNAAKGDVWRRKYTFNYSDGPLTVVFQSLIPADNSDVASTGGAQIAAATLVPEPTTALVGAGLCGLLMFRRRRHD